MISHDTRNSCHNEGRWIHCPVWVVVYILLRGCIDCIAWWCASPFVLHHQIMGILNLCQTFCPMMANVKIVGWVAMAIVNWGLNNQTEAAAAVDYPRSLPKGLGGGHLIYLWWSHAVQRAQRAESSESKEQRAVGLCTNRYGFYLLNAHSRMDGGVFIVGKLLSRRSICHFLAQYHTYIPTW